VGCPTKRNQRLANFPIARIHNERYMPAGLVKAHANLDKAVDSAYSYKGKTVDPERVTFLFERYLELTNVKRSQ
jgi:hypothetical protein